ncbi:ATP-binding protein [Amycolatopsis sp. PS_44_ISF1]|uniref:ATP-binding protein n=1 Tax=Amycolatopsis sp. PS_44_ISF1 TaxID=2974917 RepID=UPI0028DF55A8|nr:ATP-binding protein [Amycolatopsis sp. PS_44_ISF1]MDT8915248.1 ATP-binding protein [Amycolatopsis sp. PS_44_ISF1]
MTEFSLAGADGETLRRVRSWVRANLADVDGDALSDAVQVVDELTTNALSHGSPPQRLRLLRRPGRVRVEVDDSGPAQARPREPSTTGGRGLLLVAAISDDWGQYATPTGKTVWAELPLAGG